MAISINHYFPFIIEAIEINVCKVRIRFTRRFGENLLSLTFYLEHLVAS